MALMSPPIAVADATPVSFAFAQRLASVNVQVVFYTTSVAAQADQISPRGTGSRDLTATNSSSAFEGDFADPGDVQTFTSDIHNGTLVSAVDGRWYELTLGSGLTNVTLTAAVDVTPGTAVTYRLVVDAPGSSALA